MEEERMELRPKDRERAIEGLARSRTKSSAADRCRTRPAAERSPGATQTLVEVGGSATGLQPAPGAFL